MSKLIIIPHRPGGTLSSRQNCSSRMHHLWRRFIYICLSIYPSIYLSIYLYLYLYISSSVPWIQVARSLLAKIAAQGCIITDVASYIYVYLSIHLSIYLSIYLYLYLYISSSVPWIQVARSLLAKIAAQGCIISDVARTEQLLSFVAPMLRNPVNAAADRTSAQRCNLSCHDIVYRYTFVNICAYIYIYKYGRSNSSPSSRPCWGTPSPRTGQVRDICIYVYICKYLCMFTYIYI